MPKITRRSFGDACYACGRTRQEFHESFPDMHKRAFRFTVFHQAIASTKDQPSITIDARFKDGGPELERTPTYSFLDVKTLLHKEIDPSQVTVSVIEYRLCPICNTNIHRLDMKFSGIIYLLKLMVRDSAVMKNDPANDASLHIESFDPEDDSCEICKACKWA